VPLMTETFEDFLKLHEYTMVNFVSPNDGGNCRIIRIFGFVMIHHQGVIARVV
jgi:hypothetical protein